ncbi:MAG: hypothetical protein IJH78_03805 [Clostridia bacterium]|nr:hypothetical protein [Clostridia bacterium]
MGISVEAEPDTFTGPGELTLTYSITNASRKVLENIRLISLDGEIAESAGDLARDKSMSFSHIHMLTQDELNSGEVVYTLSCTYEGVQYSYPVHAQVFLTAEGPHLELRRILTCPYAAAGQPVTIAYQLRNTGGTDAADIILRDRLGDFLVNLDRLAPNDNYTTAQQIILTEDAVSRVTLSYQDTNSKPQLFSLELEPAEIHIAETSLTASLSASRSMEDPELTEVVLTLMNEGDLAYTGLSIDDDIQGLAIAQNVEVPAGEMVHFSRNYIMRGDSDYRWRISGFTPTGLPLVLTTDTATIYQASDAGNIALSLIAETASEHISRKGYIEVILKARNDGTAIAKNVVIAEDTDGAVYTLAAVPPGEPTVHTFLTEIAEDRVIRYSAAYEGTDGEHVTVYSNPLNITIGRGGTQPARYPNNRSQLNGLTDRFHSSPLLLIALIASVVLLVVLLLILIITTYRRRFHRRVRREATRQLRETAARTGRIKALDDKTARTRTGDTKP